MFVRLIVLIAVSLLAGCGTKTPQPAPAEKAVLALPPEVEFDPAAATEKHRAAQKAPRR